MDGFLTACRMLEEVGTSAIDVSGAWMNHKEDVPYFLEQTIKAAEEVTIPVCLVGGVRGQDTIEKILNDTPIQYISMARPLTAKSALMMEWKKE